MIFGAALDLSFHDTLLNTLALKLGVWAFGFFIVGIAVLTLMPRLLRILVLPALTIGALYLFAKWIS